MPVPARVVAVLGLVIAAVHTASAAEEAQAILLLHDDVIHRFDEVSTSLRALGIEPTRAMALTQEVSDTGYSIVSKGTAADAHVAEAALAREGLSVSVVLTREADEEVTHVAPSAGRLTCPGPPQDAT